MSRALLNQAHNAMQEIYFHILSSNNNLPYKKLQESIEAITAALAQPEPEPVAWRFVHMSQIFHQPTKPTSLDCFFEPEQLTPLYAAPPAPDTLTQSKHAADVSKYESEITMLRCDLIDKQAVMQEVITAYDKAKADLADMTAQRDQWKTLLDIAREVYDTTAAKALADIDTELADADQLDAQRYRWLRESERGQIGGRSVTSIDAAIDAAIKEDKL
jgi:hypothetical protein